MPPATMPSTYFGVRGMKPSVVREMPRRSPKRESAGATTPHASYRGSRRASMSAKAKVKRAALATRTHGIPTSMRSSACPRLLPHLSPHQRQSSDRRGRGLGEREPMWPSTVAVLARTWSSGTTAPGVRMHLMPTIAFAPTTMRFAISMPRSMCTGSKCV